MNDRAINAVLLASIAMLALTSCAPMEQKPAAPTAAAAAPAAPPPAWQQGRSADQADSKLAPVPGKNTVTPASEIPIGNLKLPPGFKAEIWATGMPGGRAMARGEQGKIYLGTRALGRVYEVTDDARRARAASLSTS